jgi:hypothetical protein
MLRVLAASALAVTGLALGGVSPAQADSSGLARDFPVGTCISYRADHLALDANDVALLTPVSCTDPQRKYRVTAQVANVTLCGPSANMQYTTRDVVVLCVVQDRPAVAPPIYVGPPPFGSWGA